METRYSTSSTTLIWLRDFYQRFEESASFLYERESIWRTCQCCPDGHCCQRASYIARGRSSNPYLYEDWWLMLEYARDKFSAADRNRLAKNIKAPGPACIFLANKRCMVHAARPWTSRIHPYTVSFLPNSRYFTPAVIELPSCPTLARRFGLKVDELSMQSVTPIQRDEKTGFVQVEIRKARPLWVIDASPYMSEYESHVPPPKKLPEMQALFQLAWEAGGEHAELLTHYLEKIFQF